ncbi:MAG: dTDP-4-dehydrorhamnose reductase [Candidatus Kerfeldbacteria bacterium]|nr:dTDP-4-dehydrorhamnose reductase [Candidatus Kerfeldbacteria bacterium]
MKILVTGGSGQLGQELMRRASELGIDAIGTTRGELDVTQPEQVDDVFERVHPDVLINTSAYHVVLDCETHADAAFLTNTVAVAQMALKCKERDVQFITYTTDYVFDGTKGTPYVETDVTHPLQMYGLSKLAGEIAARNMNKSSIVIRTCGVYGGKTGSSSKKGNFVLYILGEAETKSAIEVSSEQIVNPTFAGHLADATLALLHKQPTGGVYHLANSGYCSWAEFAQEIVKFAGKKLEVIPVDRGGTNGTMKRPLFSALENTKAKALGVTLPTWKEGVQAYIEYLQHK